MKVVAKANLERPSDSGQVAAGLRLVEGADVYKGQLGSKVRSRAHHTVSGPGSTRSARAGGAVPVRSSKTRLDNQGRPEDSADAASQPRVTAPAEKTFDNLLKILAGHAAQLPTEEQSREQEIRKALVESLRDFDEDRTTLAENLLEYK